MTNKFQTGGQVFFNAVANPFSDAAVADRTSSAAQSSKAATQELVPKELILELYKKGIPVDVDYVTQQLSRLEDRLNKGLPVTKAMTHSVMSKINKVLQNSKYLEDAEKYSHTIGILDLNTMKLDLINNPYAFNFYKFEILCEKDIEDALRKHFS